MAIEIFFLYTRVPKDSLTLVGLEIAQLWVESGGLSLKSPLHVYRISLSMFTSTCEIYL